MTKPLLSIQDLLRATWEQFARDWKHTLEVSIWFLIPPLLLLIAYLAGRSLSSTVSTILILVAALAGTIITLHISIRLTKFILAKSRDPKTPVPPLSVPWSLFFSFLWLSILQWFATLGGAILLILPGIWLAVGLLFARLFLLEDGLKGTQALAASMALVKGRWWPTLWRLIVPGILLIAATTLALELISSLIGLIAGQDRMAFLSTVGNAPSLDRIFASATYQYFMQSLGEVLFLPLFLAWQVKLFHALKEK